MSGASLGAQGHRVLHCSLEKPSCPLQLLIRVCQLLPPRPSLLSVVFPFPSLRGLSKCPPSVMEVLARAAAPAILLRDVHDAKSTAILVLTTLHLSAHLAQPIPLPELAFSLSWSVPTTGCSSAASLARWHVLGLCAQVSVLSPSTLRAWRPL